MTTRYDRRSQIEELFEAALGFEPSERTLWLDARCDGDPELLAEVQALLAAHELAEQVFAGDDGPESIEWIGPYRVVRELGRGGMGAVYLAERGDGQYQRRVAIKLIPATPAGDPLHRRFLAERQILAGLEHPNIARLLDGAETDDGRPYLVLEYVDGLPITAFCDRHRLDIRERLQLFLDVCSAVQHAHQNLIIHRDLKPANILVTAAKQVRLLDFGIAKLLNPALSAVNAPLTQLEARAMTPEYASPEQVRGESLTTASDIYSLGVLLYELLCGLRPYELATTAPIEIAKAVCDQDPERPSVRAARGDAHTTDGTPTDSEGRHRRGIARGTSAERLPRELQGDLDSIVLMALRKEPGRRYASADLLHQDIERYLGGLPVLAHRGSRRYRVGKFARRHRVEVLAAGVVAASLFGGMGLAAWQARVARAERDGAQRARAQAEEAREQSEEVTRFLMGLFEASDPSLSRGDVVTARELLERGVGRIEELSGQAMVQARMLDVVGRVYGHLGRYERAEPLLARALALRREHLDEANVDVAASLRHLAVVWGNEGRYDDAESLFRQAIALQADLLGPHDLEGAESLLGLASLLHRRGKHADADALYREALAIQQEQLGTEHPDAIRTEARLAVLLRDRGDREGAAVVLQRTLDLRRGLWGETHPEVAGNITQLATLHAGRGENALAVAHFREALEIRRRLYGDEHPEVAQSLQQVGSMLALEGRLEEAAELQRQAIGIFRRVLGDSHPATASALNSYGLTLRSRGDLAEAEQAFRDAVANYFEAGEESPNAATILINLGETRRQAGDLLDAERIFRQALDMRRRVLDADHPYLASIALRLARLLREQGRHVEAEPLYLEALTVYGQRPSEAQSSMAAIRTELAELYSELERPAEAARYLEVIP